ncbi:hypothetical protein V1290_006052 [Bradyrhizobium sp. AZCC 1578]|uniref:hypothetical protein n=1 Tax=Bradyrhizobium sp. AZCC 1578 TaxID=3117027 RepID=UPI002FF2AF8D
MTSQTSMDCRAGTWTTPQRYASLMRLTGDGLRDFSSSFAVRPGQVEMIGDKIRGYFSSRQSTRPRLCVIEHCHSLIAPAEIEEQPTILLPNSGLSEHRAQHPPC